MRPFQLSAVLVSAAMLLSGCYVFRGPVDRSRIELAATEDEVCHVSGLPIFGEVAVTVYYLSVTFFAVMFSAPRSEIVKPALISGLFAADAVAGFYAVGDCSGARGEWLGMLNRYDQPPLEEGSGRESMP